MHTFKSIFLLIISLLFALASCDVGDETSAPQQLVVEGRIEAGEFPVVKLTRSLSVTKEGTAIDNIGDYMERWAKVTISDGEHEEVMVGIANRDYFPPYIYTCNEMRGEVGRTYRLTVETTDGLRAEGITTIPQPLSIDSFTVSTVAQGDTVQYQLYGYTSCRRKGKLFTRVIGRDTEFLSAYLGILDSTNIAADGRIAINAGRSMFISTLLNEEQDKDRENRVKFSPYFRPTDVVVVKYAALDSTAYTYWRKFEDMADLSRNPLFPVATDLLSNVNGALGYWFGYGSSVYVVSIPELSQRRQ